MSTVPSDPSQVETDDQMTTVDEDRSLSSYPDAPEWQSSRRRRPSRAGAVVWALILIGAGLWFLAGNLGVDLPDLDQMWPLFVLLPGLGFLAGYIFGEDHDPGLAFVGTAATLLGVFFFMAVLGVGNLETTDMGRLWPVYPLIGGVAFVVLWVAGGFKDWGVLVPAALGLGVGIVGLGAVVVGETDWFFRLLAVAWPLLLIFGGLSLLAGYFVQSRR